MTGENTMTRLVRPITMTASLVLGLSLVGCETTEDPHPLQSPSDAVQPPLDTVTIPTSSYTGPTEDEAMSAATALLAPESTGDMDVARFRGATARLERLLVDDPNNSDTVYLALALLHARYAPPEAFSSPADGGTPATLDDGNLREPVERAVALLEKSIAANPTNLASLRLFAFLMENLDDERAVQSWQRLVELQPDHIEGLNRLGEGLLLLKRYGQAERVGAQALAVATDRSTEEEAGRARNVLGRAYLQTGRYDLAEKMFKDAAVRTDGSHWGCAYQSLGQLYATLGDLESSEQEVHTSDRSHLDALVLYESGKLDEALSSIETALQSTDRVEYWTLRGLFLLDLSRPEDAKQSFETAASSTPAAAGPRLGLAELAIRESRHAEAEEQVHQALKAWKERSLSKSGLPRYHQLIHRLACDLHGRLHITRQDAGLAEPAPERVALARAICGMNLQNR
ncbi:MAG TPA: hypothetical protein DIU15_18795 [Deltaproteobacteria bacterium]|nr:hypothetical protein [Deltaproteobacteria bacterium]